MTFSFKYVTFSQYVTCSVLNMTVMFRVRYSQYVTLNIESILMFSVKYMTFMVKY